MTALVDSDAASLDASSRMRARWTHPRVDPRDVEERIALRFESAAAPETRVVACPPACRVFVRDELAPARKDEEHEDERAAASGWCSRYVHAIGDVDAALAWIAARIAERRTEREERARRRAQRAKRAA